ncbi:hypothetical protein B0I37DRAFT_397498 [Chaetomium sp. MPI-CAGE-AT-0009]|nr:hypothetical protein B0I37DRAFT_397498 [Chaetomium sp. MPI-CAGE-AT-0009]
MANAPQYGVSCPSGGSFYICENNATEFVGCCTFDPCADDSGTCGHNNLRPASFRSDSDSYKDIPEQECSSLSMETKWYICANDKTNFMGCCHHANPCIAGSCQAGYIVPARLSSNTFEREAFIEVMEASAPAFTPTSTAATSNIESSSNTGTVVGITIASTIGAIAILAFVVFKLSELDVVAAGQLSTGAANVTISPFAESFGSRHPSQETWFTGPTAPTLAELDGNRWAPSDGTANFRGDLTRP